MEYTHFLLQPNILCMKNRHCGKTTAHHKTNNKEKENKMTAIEINNKCMGNPHADDYFIY